MERSVRILDVARDRDQKIAPTRHVDANAVRLELGRSTAISSALRVGDDVQATTNTWTPGLRHDGSIRHPVETAMVHLPHAVGMLKDGAMGRACRVRLRSLGPPQPNGTEQAGHDQTPERDPPPSTYRPRLHGRRIPAATSHDEGGHEGATAFRLDGREDQPRQPCVTTVLRSRRCVAGLGERLDEGDELEDDPEPNQTHVAALATTPARGPTADRGSTRLQSSTEWGVHGG